MEDVQRSLRRGNKERWDAGRAQGYRESKGCLSSSGRAGTGELWERCRRHGGHQQGGQGSTSRAWAMYPS